MHSPSSGLEWLLPSCFQEDGVASRALAALRVPGSADPQSLVALNVRRMLKVLYPDVIFRVQSLSLTDQPHHLRVLYAQFPDSPTSKDVENALGLWVKVTVPIGSGRVVHQGRHQFQAIMGWVYNLEVHSHPAQSLDVSKRRKHAAQKAHLHLKSQLPGVTSTPSKPRM